MDKDSLDVINKVSETVLKAVKIQSATKLVANIANTTSFTGDESVKEARKFLVEVFKEK